MTEDLVAMARAAERDERLSDGALYGKLAEEIETLRSILDGRRAHKTMTPEEYAAMPIIGWHMVCRDYDGFGGVGVRFITGGGTE